MTEKMIARLDDLRARQQAGEHMRCPRCGQDTMKPDLKTNALSRHVENARQVRAARGLQRAEDR